MVFRGFGVANIEHYSQDSERENATQGNLLARVDLEPQDHRQWEDEDADVTEKAQSAADGAGHGLVSAGTGDGLVEVVSYWSTNSEVDDPGRYGPGDGVADVDEDCYLEVCGGKDAQVE